MKVASSVLMYWLELDGEEVGRACRTAVRASLSSEMVATHCWSVRVANESEVFREEGVVGFFGGIAQFEKREVWVSFFRRRCYSPVESDPCLLVKETLKVSIYHIMVFRDSLLGSLLHLDASWLEVFLPGKSRLTIGTHEEFCTNASLDTRFVCVLTDNPVAILFYACQSTRRSDLRISLADGGEAEILLHDGLAMTNGCDMAGIPSGLN